MLRYPAIFVLLIVAFALAAPPQKAHQEQPQRRANQRPSVTAILKPLPGSQKTQGGTERCPGSYHPELNCNAISANADEDQARNAENQTWWFRWEVALTFGTLVVAGFAMEFARQAAKHNRRSADAAEQADRPHLLPAAVKVSDLAEPEFGGKIDFTFNIVNHGTAPAWVKRYAIAFEAEVKIPDTTALTYFKENAAIPPKEGWGTMADKSIRFDITPEARDGVVNGTRKLALYFAVEYVGSGGRKHVHKFVQVYIPDQKRFHAMDHPFWEYT